MYVDEMVIAGNNDVAIQELKQHLNNHFHMNNLGQLRYFLGLKIARSEEGIFISQRKYVLDLLQEAGMRTCNSLKFPRTPNLKLMSDTSKYMENPKQYRRLIGQLIYLTTTKPDINYSVQLLS